MLKLQLCNFRGVNGAKSVITKLKMYRCLNLKDVCNVRCVTDSVLSVERLREIETRIHKDIPLCYVNGMLISVLSVSTARKVFPFHIRKRRYVQMCNSVVFLQKTYSKH